MFRQLYLTPYAPYLGAYGRRSPSRPTPSCTDGAAAARGRRARRRPEIDGADGDGIVAAMRGRLLLASSRPALRRARASRRAASASPSPSSTSPASPSPRSSAPSCAPACAAGSPPASRSCPTPRSSAPSPSAASSAATPSPACAASARWSWCVASSRRPSRSSAPRTSSTTLELVDLGEGKSIATANDDCTACNMKEVNDGLSNAAAALKMQLEPPPGAAPPRRRRRRYRTARRAAPPHRGLYIGLAAASGALFVASVVTLAVSAAYHGKSNCDSVLPRGRALPDALQRHARHRARRHRHAAVRRRHRDLRLQAARKSARAVALVPTVGVGARPRSICTSAGSHRLAPSL